MSHPIRSNPGGSSKHHGPSAHPSHPGIHQSHSFSSYHPASSYYYQQRPYSQQHQLSPITVQYNAHHHYPYHHPHHGGHRGHRDRTHHSSPATPWPAPPSSLHAEENMETSSHSSPSPPAITTADATSLSESPLPTEATGADASAASTLSALANASASAGPLKKRRKVDKDPATKNEAAAKLPRGFESPSVDSPTAVNNDSSYGTDFPSLLHKLLARGDNKEGNGKSDVVDYTPISSAVEWLPRGDGWRVLRWDTLCIEVLPKEFPKLCHDVFPRNVNKSMETDHAKEEDGKDEDTEKDMGQFSDDQWVEAFLWHVRAWGFEEVKSGRDRGSFHHQWFTKDSPELCTKMTCRRINSSVAVASAYSPVEIGRSTSSLGEPEYTAAWRKSHKVVSSIFKPRRSRDYSHHKMSPHPSHLHVPVLSSTTTHSFADHWGSEHGPGGEHHGPHHHHQYYPPPYPPPHPPPTRSPKMIRFRDEAEWTPFHHRDDAVEITPNADASPTTSSRKTLPANGRFHGGAVSRRGRRPGLISRHATN